MKQYEENMRVLLFGEIRRKSVTLEEIAPQIGVSSSYLSLLLSGKRGKIEVYGKVICDYLGLKYWEIVRKAEEE